MASTEKKNQKDILQNVELLLFCHLLSMQDPRKLRWTTINGVYPASIPSISFRCGNPCESRDAKRGRQATQATTGFIAAGGTAPREKVARSSSSGATRVERHYERKAHLMSPRPANATQRRHLWRKMRRVICADGINPAGPNDEWRQFCPGGDRFNGKSGPRFAPRCIPPFFFFLSLFFFFSFFFFCSFLSQRDVSVPHDYIKSHVCRFTLAKVCLH